MTGAIRIIERAADDVSEKVEQGQLGAALGSLLGGGLAVLLFVAVQQIPFVGGLMTPELAMQIGGLMMLAASTAGARLLAKIMGYRAQDRLKSAASRILTMENEQ